MHWVLLLLVATKALASPVDEEKAVAKAGEASERDEKCEFSKVKQERKVTYYNFQF